MNYKDTLKANQLPLILLTQLLISFVILYLFNGTGGEADSINHYLFAKHAPHHPRLYLNHWGKPLFTLLASPFAQFGFNGVKTFNIIMSLIASLYVYKIAKYLNLKNIWLAPIMAFVMPLSFKITFSGLTEPMFAALLSISIFLFIQKKYIFTAILVSFLPFVRSEGLLILGVFGLFFAIKKQYWSIAFLSIGHLLYSVSGFFHYNDLFWVFNKIPYANLGSPYGSGSLFHFADKLTYILGIPLLILFYLGVLQFIILATKKQWQANLNAWLVFSLFVVFFIAHSLFWYLEIFNSMGLKRVFGAVIPLLAIFCLFGFNLIEKIKFKKLRRSFKILVVLLIIGFPFTSNPAAVEWEELNLSNAEINAIKVADYIHSKKLENNIIIYAAPYLGEALDIDPFSEKYSNIMSPASIQNIGKGELIVWDNWHSVVDYGVTLDQLSQFKLIKSFEQGNSVYKIYTLE